MACWIELYQTLPTHRKTMRLKNLLRVDQPKAVGMMVMLWLWAVDNARDGDITDFTPAELADVMGFSARRAGELTEALVASGFVDERGGRLTIHNWQEHVGRLLELRQKKRDKERQRYSAQKKSLPAESVQTAGSLPFYTTQEDTTPPELTEEYIKKQIFFSADDDAGESSGVHADTDSFFRRRFYGVKASKEVAERCDALTRDIVTRFLGREPEELDYLNVREYVCVPDIHSDYRPSYDPQRGDLLIYAFEQSVSAGKPGSWPYIHGILKRLEDRNLGDVEKILDYEYNRRTEEEDHDE